MTTSARDRERNRRPSPEDLLALERDAWLDLVRHADPGALAAAGLSAVAIGPALAVRCRAGGPLLNRAYGVPATAASLRAVRTHYESAAVPLYFLQLDGTGGEREIAAAGLVRYRRAMVYLAHAMGPVAPVVTGLEVGPASRAEMLRGAEIFCAAFDVERGVAPVFASLIDAPRWRFVVARAHGEPVAFGMLYVDGDVACLFGGATAPRFRQRGAQGALVAARIELARGLGCRVVGAHTGEAVAGDPQHSYRNMLRAGFEPIGRVETYAPPDIVWTHGRRGVGAS